MHSVSTPKSLFDGSTRFKNTETTPEVISHPENNYNASLLAALHVGDGGHVGDDGSR